MAENDDTAAGGQADATQPSQPPSEAPPPVTQPTPPATEPAPATPAAVGEAATQAPPPPPATPAKAGAGGGGVPTPAFVVVAIVAVAALAFGILSFLGKSSETDKKEDAQEEADSKDRQLAAANDEIAAANEEIVELEDENAQLSEDLGGSEDFAAALDEVLGTGQTAADSLYDCAVTAYDFILNFLNTNNPDVGQAQAVDDRCASAEDNYNTFNAALNVLR